MDKNCSTSGWRSNSEQRPGLMEGPLEPSRWNSRSFLVEKMADLFKSILCTNPISGVQQASDVPARQEVCVGTADFDSCMDPLAVNLVDMTWTSLTTTCKDVALGILMKAQLPSAAWSALKMYYESNNLSER